jgi:hypothetical protein
MPYVPGFANDIFISFAHVDNFDGWVEEFQSQLRNRLLQIGADVTIWRDSKLRGTDIFSDEIFSQLQQSALLISIVSPTGIKSNWCEDERQAFERLAELNGGLRFGNHLRAIKVVKTPLPADKHRGLFDDLGFEFYQRKEQSDRFEEFDLTSTEFRKKRDEMAQDIKSVLDAFSDYLANAPKKDTVYVATTTPDLTQSREAIVRQLEDWGYAVRPQDSEPPRLRGSFQSVTKAELAASIFSVHLVSDQPKPIVEDAQDSIRGQYELAQSVPKDRIVWIGPGVQLYSEFDVAIKTGLQKGVEVLKDRPLEDLKDVIEERLNRRRQQQPLSPPKSQDKVELYLICDRPDHPSWDDSTGNQRALKVKEYLDDSGVVVMPSPFSEMEWTELEEEYGAQLQLSDAVLLYWGTASENWFLKIRRIIVKEQTRRNKTSNAGTLTEAFYFGSPPMKKSQYKKLSDLVIEQYDDFDPSALKPLVDRLLANEEA